MLRVFGWSLVRWPSANALEAQHQKFVEMIKAREQDMGDIAVALTASIQTQQGDLVRINSLRARLQSMVQ